MKVVVDYENLMTHLVNLSSVVDDSRNDESMRFVTFLFTRDGEMKLMGVSAFITYRVTVPAEMISEMTIEDGLYSSDGIYSIQLRSKELLGFLSAYKGLRRTKVDNVTISSEMGHIKLTVCESSVDDGKESEKNQSSWVFDNLPPVKREMLNRINLKMPDDMKTIDTLPIKLSAVCAMPVMNSEMNTSGVGTLMFCSEKQNEEGEVVFPSKLAVFQSAYRVILENQYPKEFQGVSLYFRVVAFLKNIICEEDKVDFARTEQYLCFRSEGNFEAFVAFSTKVADVSPYAKVFKRDHALELDRQYFKDVLKRLSLVDEKITFAYEEGTLRCSNSHFSQAIPIVQAVGMEEIGTCSFKVMPDVLSKLVVGEDSEFPNLYMYFVPKDSGFALFLTDSTGYWLSNVNINH